MDFNSCLLKSAKHEMKTFATSDATVTRITSLHHKKIVTQGSSTIYDLRKVVKSSGHRSISRL